MLRQTLTQEAGVTGEMPSLYFLKDKGGKVTEIKKQTVGDHVIDTHMRGEAGVSPGIFIGGVRGEEKPEYRGLAQ